MHNLDLTTIVSSNTLDCSLHFKSTMFALLTSGSPLSLRQHGTSRFILCFVLALCERKKRNTKEDKVPL
jgi:hypothetical protein